MGLQASAISPSPAAACFDYSNAFPTLYRPYLWSLLSTILCPSHILFAIQNLCAKAMHFILPQYHQNIVIFVLEGLKQGCHLAAFFFSLAISPLINALHRAATPSPSP